MMTTVQPSLPDAMPTAAGRHMRRHLQGAVGALCLSACLIALTAPSLATAAVPSPHWLMLTQAAPTDFHPGDTQDFYEVIAFNDGDVPTSGPITVTDTLPAGLVVDHTYAYAEVIGVKDSSFEEFVNACEQTSSENAVTVTCTIPASVPVERAAVVNITVEVPAGLQAGASLSNTAKVSGGGAQPASYGSLTAVTESSTPVPFGATLAAEATRAGGNVDTQAGSHPFSFTTLTAFNVATVVNEKCDELRTPSCPEANAQARDIEVALPPGLVGNPTAVPYCTQVQFEQNGFEKCPPATQVGSLHLYFYGSGTAIQYAPVYNIEPPPGQPAELGFTVSTAAHIPLFFHLRSDGDYGLTADISTINQFDPVRIAQLSIWGNPSDAAHDPLRLSSFEHCGFGSGGCPSGVKNPKPFLTLPTSCSGDQLTIPVAGDSWQEPEPAPFAVLTSANMPGMTGCEALRFNPSLAVTPTSRKAGAQTGLNVDLKVPQNEELTGLATPALRDVEVTLPEGMVVSPSGSNGLVACSGAQFGEKIRAKGHCPAASKIASVKVTTPLLSEPVTGSLFVGEPECSPCTPAQAGSGQMVHMLLEAEGSGIVVKLSGHTKINQATGQLTAVFTNNPQEPVSDLSVAVESGPTAPLVNPSTCGLAVTAANVTPWSSETASSITAPAIPIEGCAPAGFGPAFEAGATDTGRAGAFTGLEVTMSRQDSEEAFGRVSVTTPPGLLGLVKSVERCPEAQANAGTCGVGSQIGEGYVTAGQGPAPLTIGGVKVYLTGPYEGQPFGLSIVTPAQAGPFVLAGNTGSGSEVVRAAISIDPSTAALTVTSDQLPQSLNGIPLDIRKIHLDIDRPSFIFNPTNCDPLAIHASFESPTGTKSGAAVAVQSTDCAALAFKPSFSASTQGAASKRNGASLTVKVTEKPGEADIRKVDLSLPIQLPSRLSTLQQACTEAQFAANPAGCPEGSVIGAAKAVTPVLASPLEGPAILVSHGGAAFPDVEFVLQGEGVEVVLDGKTDIKKGVTYSRFETVPDAPITSFETRLPEGPHSALGAFLPKADGYNLCALARTATVTRHVNRRVAGHIRQVAVKVTQQLPATLGMPTTITAQNGAVFTQTTHIAVTGCPKATVARKTRGATKAKGAKKAH